MSNEMDNPTTKSGRLAIINAKCFYKKNRKYLDEIITSLSNKNAEIKMTRYQKHASQIAKDSKNVHKEIIVVGGDGTVSEVVNGMDLKRQKLCILPAGYGNDLAVDLGIYSWKESLAALDKNEVSDIDLIKATIKNDKGEIFEKQIVSSASFGYLNFRRIKKHTTVDILDRVEKKTNLEELQKLFKVKIRVDEGDWEDFTLNDLIVGNTRNIYKKPIFKSAHLNDEKFHCLLGNIGALKKIVTNISGSHYGVKKEFKKMELKFEVPQIVMLDGEIYKDCIELSFSSSPDKLQCIKK